MSQSQHPSLSVFSQVDVSAANSSETIGTQLEQTELLREVLAAQDRTNELLAAEDRRFYGEASP